MTWLMLLLIHLIKFQTHYTYSILTKQWKNSKLKIQIFTIVYQIGQMINMKKFQKSLLEELFKKWMFQIILMDGFPQNQRNSQTLTQTLLFFKLVLRDQTSLTK